MIRLLFCGLNTVDGARVETDRLGSTVETWAKVVAGKAVRKLYSRYILKVDFMASDFC